MTRHFAHLLMRSAIALSLAASIALSPVAATPARAGNDDAAKVIGALIVLGLIGAAINNGNATPGSEPRRFKRLPGSCLKTFETRYGSESFFGKRCLRSNFRYWNNLPEQCALNIRTTNRNGQRVRRAVYQPRCLRENGYRIAWRR